MTYQLYGAPDNANLVIHVILEELGVPYEMQWLDRTSKEHRGEAYRQLNPQGLIPTLIDGETSVFETAAIALYLADKHQALAPTESVQRAKLYQWLFFLSNTLHADLRIQFYAHRHVTSGEAEAPLRAGTLQRIKQHLKLLEDELQRHDGPWLLAGEALSILDIYLGVMCRWMTLYPAGKALEVRYFDELPKLKALLESLQSRPSFERACEEETIGAPYLLGANAPRKPSQ